MTTVRGMLGNLKPCNTVSAFSHCSRLLNKVGEGILTVGAYVDCVTLHGTAVNLALSAEAFCSRNPPAAEHES